MGDYNAASHDGVPAGDPDWVSTLVAADAVTLLSNAWRDSRSPWGPVFSTADNRVASSTHYQTAIFTGANSQIGNAFTFTSAGGIHNFLRYIEDWYTGTAMSSVHGSIVYGFYSVFQHQPYYYDGVDGPYQAPHPRDYVFDSHFSNPSNQPPGSPSFTVSAVRSWNRY